MRLVLPTVSYATQTYELAKRATTLDGRAIGFLDGWSVRNPDGSYGMYPLMAELRRLLAARFVLADVIWIRKAKAGSPATREQMERIVTRCAAAIAGVGLSGGSTAGAVADAVELERRGVPSLTICYAGYERAARIYARTLGAAEIPLLVVPSPSAGNVASDMRALAERSFDTVLAALVAEHAS